MPENPASYRVVRTKSYLFNKAVDVLKARLKRDPLLALELVNPELDLVRQLALNGKTRAIREQAMRKLDELY
ncbi:DUF2773 domain-containing protein [Escherichia coli]|nr:DUF2773 domain-containing protein [Escherichia coli]EFB9775831.1 DUF2773 domain-containing protein [Escherichia coli]TAA14214.1 DUF2773 domain-containing protein [Escherichia coli]